MIALRIRAEHEPFERIKAHSRLGAVKLNHSAHVNNNRMKRRRLIIVYVHAPTDCSSAHIKEHFYQNACQFPDDETAV